MQPGKWHHVDGQLAKVGVELTRKPKARRDPCNRPSDAVRTGDGGRSGDAGDGRERRVKEVKVVEVKEIKEV